MLNKLIAPLLTALCLAATAHAAGPVTISTNFMSGPSGWSAGFGDYPVGSEKFYELKSGIRRLPPSIKLRSGSFLLSGNNHSDDLCMFMRKPVVGLLPNTRYNVTFSVTFASASPRDAFGVGGAPNIPVKAGISRKRPSILGEYARLNIDKGNQTVGGDDAMVIGDTGVDVPIGGDTYRLKTLTNKGRPFHFSTDASGKGWIFLCTDSGFEATTSVYFTHVKVKMVPLVARVD
jgi:hypothetical protein